MNLQPLRIDAGWTVTYNQLYEVDPIAGFEDYFDGSSLLMLQNRGRLKFIDVAWRPELDINGEFEVVVLNFLENFNSKTNDFDVEVDWEVPLLTYTTKSRIELVAKLEELMRILPVYKDPRILDKRGVVNETSEAFRLELNTNGISDDLIQNILEKGNAKIQNLILDHAEITRSIVLKFYNEGTTKKVRNKANQKLNSKRFKE